MLKRNAHLLDKPLPLLAFSFSSKGFHNLPALIAAYKARLPDAYLLSLYDHKYILCDCLQDESQDARIRIWDSGGYETSKQDDLSSHFSAVSADRPWSEDLYVETANSISLGERDILVSYDSYENRIDIPIAAQVENACRLFDRIPGNYLRDMLLHVNAEADPRDVAEALVSFAAALTLSALLKKGSLQLGTKESTSYQE